MHNQKILAENIINNSDAGILVVDNNLCITVWNNWLEQASGLKADDIITKPLSDIVNNLNGSRLFRSITNCIDNTLSTSIPTSLDPHPLPLYIDNKNHTPSGYMFQQISVKPISFEENNPMALVHILDVTESMIREDKLRSHTRELNTLMDDVSKREIQVRTVLENALDGIITIDTNGCIEEYNPAAEKIFGYTREEILGKSISILIPAILPAAYDVNNKNTMSKSLVPFLGTTRELPAIRKDKSTLMLEFSLNKMKLHNENSFVGSMRDITKRTQAEQLVRHMAQHDALTNLPNRNLFKDRLIGAIAQAKRHSKIIAVMFLDLDRFKTINDTLGHHIGDALLTEVARRLESMTRGMDTVARLGGDEFAIIQTDIKNPDGVIVFAEKIISAISQPFKFDGNEINTSASIGVTLYPADNGDADQLLQNADMSMYRAKRAGRNNFQFYNAEMHEEIQHFVEMEKEIRRALIADEFILHYQPQIDLDDGSVVGVEALVRWIHPERGMIPPDQFIPIAEDSGLILPLGHLVLVHACRWAKSWQDAGNKPLQVAVNLSAVQFNDPKLVDNVAATLEQTGLSAEYLELELTESLLMKHADATVETLNELHNLNIELAIDDFGTGYSSLSYLKRFPVSKIKIDRSFVNDITTDKDDAIIAQTVIGLGHSLGMKVIAEGVETQEQLDFLKFNECDEVQGYFTGRPMPAEQLEEYMASRPSTSQPEPVSQMTKHKVTRIR